MDKPKYIQNFINSCASVLPYFLLLTMAYCFARFGFEDPRVPLMQTQIEELQYVITSMAQDTYYENCPLGKPECAFSGFNFSPS